MNARRLWFGHFLRPWLLGIIVGLGVIVISSSTRSYTLRYLFSASRLEHFWVVCFFGYLVCQTTTILGWALTDHAYQYYINFLQVHFSHYVRKHVKQHDAVNMSTLQSYRTMDKIRTLESTFSRIIYFLIYHAVYVSFYLAMAFFMVYFEIPCLAWTLLSVYTLCIFSTGWREWHAADFITERKKVTSAANKKLFNTLHHLSTAWYFFEPHPRNRTLLHAKKLTSAFRERTQESNRHAYQALTQNLILIMMSSAVLGLAMFYYLTYRLPFAAFFMIFFLNLSVTDQVYGCMKNLGSFVMDVRDFRSNFHVLPHKYHRRHYATLQNPCGEIRFDHVSFRYPEGPWIIQDLTVTIPGKACCIVTGPLGCGKSTFLQLCAGILKPEKGTIFMDSIPQTEMTLSLLDRLISYVGEAPCVWPESIQTNLMPMPKHSVSWETMERWCQQCGMDAWIQTLPKAYAYDIQDPEHLSFGQRQIFSILRGLGKECPFLILDYLPLQSDAMHTAVQAFTQTQTKNRTVLRTAHCPMESDLVIHLPDGAISDSCSKNKKSRKVT